MQSAAGSFADFAGTNPARPSSLLPDMGTFDSDAGTFLRDQSGGLEPGWPAEARAVEQDIQVLADDCKINFVIPKGYTV